MIDIILPISFLILLLYYLFFLFTILDGLKKLKSKNQKGKIPDEFISIIIPFRNEENNILKNLESLEKQNFPKNKFEIIYVNDSSTDNSLEKLEQNAKSENVNVISINNGNEERGHKKRAVNFGIENSSGEIIITTDADCIYNKNWLTTLLSYFDENTGFISGPVKFKDAENIFEELQQIEFAGLVLTGAGLVGSRKPTICNAANISYRKNVFGQVNGFTDHLNFSSGDDEFLMQKISKDTNYNVKFCFEKDSVVETGANKTLSEFFNQRKRWASKGLFYKNKSLILSLILIYLYYVSIPVLIVLSIINFKIYFPILLISLLFKFIFEYLILQKGKQILFNKFNPIKFFFVEILQISYIIIAAFLGALGNFIWKDRKVQR